MKLDQTLRDKLKNMPRIEPQTSRATLRQQVLTEVEKRERNPKKMRRYVLPTVFASAVAVFMFIIISPWVMQQEKDTAGMDSGSEVGMMSEDSLSDEDLELHEEDLLPRTGDEEGQDQSDEAPIEQGESEPESSPSPNEQSPEREDSTTFSMTQALTVESRGQVTRELAIEGMNEQTIFDRYIVHPYGLQVLIPVMSNGDKWFGEPYIDGGASRSVGFGSLMEVEKGQLFLSPITVSVHEEQSVAEVQEDIIYSFTENDFEAGDGETLPNGERLKFYRTMGDEQGNDYTYIAETFITEQNGRTFAIHVGRNAVTNEGWEPRLVEVVYPEFKVVNR